MIQWWSLLLDIDAHKSISPSSKKCLFVIVSFLAVCHFSRHHHRKSSIFLVLRVTFEPPNETFVGRVWGPCCGFVDKQKNSAWAKTHLSHLANLVFNYFLYSGFFIQVKFLFSFFHRIVDLQCDLGMMSLPKLSLALQVHIRTHEDKSQTIAIS